MVPETELTPIFYLCVFCIVNEKAVATDEVYYATENGQIFDVDYRNMNVFRKGTLYNLLCEVPSTIGRMARPNNIIDRNRRNTRGDNSVANRSNFRADGSFADGSNVSDNNIALKRRGTVNLVKNFMFSKIQKAQASGFVDGSSMGDDRAFDGSRLDNAKRSRTNNVSMAPRGPYDRE